MKNELKCFTGKCDKKVRLFIVDKQLSVNPLLCDIGNLRKLFAFFQYETPNTSSYLCSHLSNEYHDFVFDEIKRSFKTGIIDIAASNTTSTEELEKLNLLGDNLCSYCKRLFCKRKPSRNGVKETDLSCLLRHIRNSLAHGRVFVIHIGNHISVMFEDFDPRNKGNKNEISARIICTQADLKKWKNHIESAVEREKAEGHD